MSRSLVALFVAASVFGVLATAVPAGATIIPGATMIDDYSSSTLNSNWVLSNVLSGGGTGTWGTTTNPGELTQTGGGSGGTYVQQDLLRGDYPMSAGDTLYSDVFQSSSQNGGLCIATTTSPTGRKGQLSIWIANSLNLQAYYWNDSGSSPYSPLIALTSYPTGLFIAQTGATTFSLGYYQGTTQTVAFTYTIPAGNTVPGAAIGYYSHTGNGMSIVFDNLQMITPTPEPSTLALLAAGLAGLLCYAWRKRR